MEGTDDYLQIEGPSKGTGQVFTLMQTNKKGVSWFAEGGARRNRTHRKKSKKTRRTKRRRTQRNKK
jgi:hypothetical protein